MGYCITPKAGGRFLCATECSHLDCAENRKLIKMACSVCEKPLGEDARYYIEEVKDRKISKAAHGVCYEIEAEKEVASERSQKT